MSQVVDPRRSAFRFPSLGALPCVAIVMLTSPVPAVTVGMEMTLGQHRDRLSESRVIQVGRGRDVATIAQASRLARDGDAIEIEGGDYVADVAVWSQPRIVIRGVNGRPRLIASGAAAEGKGIWVVRSQDMVIDNIEFIGARVADKNGAGIRFEGNRLVVRNCRFEDNENGILGGSDDSELEIHNSEFVRNGAGDGYSHNIYVGGRRVLVHGSYVAHARAGHLLKSRAKESLILYNRLSGEDGTSSYELEFPDGGTAMVIGNLIQQGPKTENSTIVSFGTERLRWSKNKLYLSHNTIVNDRPNSGTSVFARAGNASVVAVNNVLVGAGTLNLQPRSSVAGNMTLGQRDFADPERLDYRLRFDSPAVGKAIDTAFYSGVSLRPVEEYVHPAMTKKVGPFAPMNPGAFQSVVP